MPFSEKEIFLAAEAAKTLSELLAQDGLFKADGLRWLEREHIDKFLDAIDEEESIKLSRFAARWHYPSEEGVTGGFPLLDWLWVIGPAKSQERMALTTSDRPGTGRMLIMRLAELQPDWVGRWWRWRCANGKSMRSNLDEVEDVLISVLTKEDLISRLSLLEDDVVFAIIARRPQFLELLAEERRGIVLRSALDDQSKPSSLVRALSEHGIPSNAIAVVEGVFAGAAHFSKAERESKIISRLDELVTKWQGTRRTDPIALAMIAGHEPLETLLRSPWKESLAKRDDDKSMWSHPNLSYSFGHIFAAAARAVPEKFRLELGFSIGVRISEREADPSYAQVGHELKRLDLDPGGGTVEALMPMIKLWAALRTVARYESSYRHDTELIGLRARIFSLVEDAADIWAESLPWILARSSKLGNLAEAVTLELANNNPRVRTALENACHSETEHIRLMAFGLWALLNGIEDPKSGSARTLADAAARHMDGVPIFPHPLEVMSATWLSSVGVEQAIRNGVRRAATRFQAEVSNQGGNIEEALTNSLIKEIEVEFREVQLRLKVLGTNRGRVPAPILSVRQRPTTKSIEEPVYGCDLAWLLHATVHGSYLSIWVDLVQVKKSKALQRHTNKKSIVNSWKIEVKQLADILKWSATAVYWLIASDGEVLVIPAKHLAGIKRGSKKSAAAESFTVGYHAIRSASIPLEQYLVDLLIGQWVGTTSEEVVRFVEGDSNIRPRSVVEISVSVGQENQ